MELYGIVTVGAIFGSGVAALLTLVAYGCAMYVADSTLDKRYLALLSGIGSTGDLKKGMGSRGIGA